MQLRQTGLELADLELRVAHGKQTCNNDGGANALPQLKFLGKHEKRKQGRKENLQRPKASHNHRARLRIGPRDQQIGGTRRNDRRIRQRIPIIVVFDCKCVRVADIVE